MNLLSKLLGEEKKLNKLRKTVDGINNLEAEIKNLSDEDLKNQAHELKNEIQVSKLSLDDALARAFALVREAATRTLGQRHYDVQLMGGIVLHQKGIAEMVTGEGKTLSSTAPVYLNALEGKGVHVITVNEYLATRDAVWMGQIYNFLGLSVACLTHESGYLYDPNYVVEQDHGDREVSESADKERDMTGSFKVVHEFLRPITRKEAYEADITYGTNHEFGFDYLRDNMVYDLAQQVQRSHNYAIIDEIDSVLIDEAKTPLIIAAPDRQSSDLYKTFARVSSQLIRDTDYEVDEKLKTVSINDKGIEKVESILNIDNIYNPENFKFVHYLEESLRAVALFKRDKDYVVKNNEIIIVDPFTGRMLEGRRYSGGLHQAIEAKENVLIKEESKTVASITIQNYFRMYEKLSGMTGTAQSSAEEFHKVYELDVVSIPTNKPLVRNDLHDVVYKNEKAKYDAIVRNVKEKVEAGQPVLIGTVAIEKNEIVSTFLRNAGIKHEVLNAKNHEREGEIIAQAGKSGAVTVATNMAGRGVDIVLGGNPGSPEEARGVKDAGGLHVIATERHDSRRIDNQLRGRSGRQGDPGSTQFFLSVEDDLMRVFGGDRLQKLMTTLKVPDEVPIESKIVTKSIEQAQSKVEGFNFDARKHTLEYDDVVNKQRQAVYSRRRQILEASQNNSMDEVAKEIVSNNIGRIALLPVEEMKKALVGVGILEKDEDFDYEIDDENPNRDGVAEYLNKLCMEKIDNVITPENQVYLRLPMLQTLDSLWMNHLENIDALRNSVRMRAYGQHDPLVEFRKEGFRLFQNLFAHFESVFFSYIFRFNVTASMETVEKQRDLQQKQQNNLVYGSSAGAKTAGSGSKNKKSKVGRNDPCPCRSGKKYKKCHG